VVELLLARDDVNLNSKGFENGLTPLALAALMGREEAVKLLLARDGVDPDSKGSEGLTPLSWAAGGHNAVVELLLAKDDVDLNSKDFDSKDALIGQTPLPWAAEKGHEAVVKLLLAKDGVDRDSKDSKGLTASTRTLKTLQIRRHCLGQQRTGTRR